MSTITKMTTWSRFRQFGSNLMLAEDQRADGRTKHSGVHSCLNCKRPVRNVIAS